eukprot:c15763_g1_i1.p1 GENE.c15763_g1_i1~~c15763_g1_i1.p1  ORF type:complete len:301 (-),score=119.37 c15763_g1_i1:30-890(-)
MNSVTPNFSKSTASHKGREIKKNVLIKGGSEKLAPKFPFSIHKSKSPSLPCSPSPKITLTTSSQRFIEVPIEIINAIDENNSNNHDVEEKKEKIEVKENNFTNEIISSTDKNEFLLDVCDLFAYPTPPPSPTNSVRSEELTLSYSFSSEEEEECPTFYSTSYFVIEESQKRNSLKVPVSNDSIKSRAEELRNKLKEKGAQLTQRLDLVQRQLSDLGESLPSSTRSAPANFTNQKPIRAIPKLSLPTMISVAYEETEEGAAAIDYHTEAKNLCEMIKTKTTITHKSP